MIILPNPCTEDWNRMTKAEQGRHCGKCSKVVTDFTGMSTEEVLIVLRSKKQAGESICGRFRSSHLTPLTVFKPEPVVRKIASRTRIFLAALMLVFSSALFTSCSEEPKMSDRNPKEQMHFVKREKGFRLDYVMPGYLIQKLSAANLLPEIDCVIPDKEIYMVQGIEPYYDVNDTINR